jgi:glycosyltransferase involved in cell wall biosynthesis
MKILHITKKYPNAIGGDATVVYNLEKLHAAKHELYVLTHNCPEINGENVHKFGLRDRSSNLDRISFRRLLSLITLIFWGFKNLRKVKPDIMHSHSADLGFFISLPARLYRIPIINTCHGISFPYSQYNMLKRFMEKFFLRFAGFKEITAVDEIGIKKLDEAGFNAVYVPNGVDLDIFDKKISAKNHKICFLFVGRLEQQKGLVHLIKGVKMLEEDFELLIVGEGSQENELRNVASGSDNVKFLGYLGGKELVEKYLESDVFILPSIWEGLPVSLLEAMAAGLPVIVTDVGGISGICLNGENALVVNPGNPEELASAMKKMIDDGDLRMKLGEKGRKTVEEKFSWKNTANSVMKIYHLAKR